MRGGDFKNSKGSKGLKGLKGSKGSKGLKGSKDLKGFRGFRGLKHMHLIIGMLKSLKMQLYIATLHIDRHRTARDTPMLLIIRSSMNG